MVRAHPTVPFKYGTNIRACKLEGRQLRQKIITIIGAGPIGLLCAYFAHNAGYSVQIIAKFSGENPNCAALASGGMLAPAYEFLGQENEEFTDFAFASRDLWNAVATEIGIKINPNTIAVANETVQIERLCQIQDLAKLRGHIFQKLNNEGHLNAKMAIRLATDGLINPIAAIDALRSFLKQRSVKFIDAEVYAINSGIIETNMGPIDSEQTILAAGFGSAQLRGQINELSALVPVRGQVVEINQQSPFDGTLRMGKVYILAREGKTIIGATMGRGDDDWQPRNSDIKELLAAPHEISGFIDIANITNSFCGVRPASLDNIPLVGQSSLENVFLACGAYRNGWLLAPQIAKDLIALIESGENYLPKSFDPQRFSNTISK